MRQAFLVIVAFILLSAVVVHADTIHVPGDFPTIQGGIDAAANGDVVLVAPGTYVEIIDFKGKAITVTSERGAPVTTIDGNREGSVVKFDSNETNNSILRGFTLTNGSGTIWPQGPTARGGGGVYCGQYTSPVIDGNIIAGNFVDHDDDYGLGGGIASDWYSAPVITNNIIFDNWCNALKRGSGGGICCYALCDATIINNVVFKNEAFSNVTERSPALRSSPVNSVDPCLGNGVSRSEEGIGGGILCGATNYTVLRNNTVCFNEAETFGGGLYCYNGNPPMYNMIFWMNQAPNYPEIYNQPDIKYSCIQGGYPGQGNIDADPLFVDATNNDFHLTFTSLCRDTGDNGAVTETYDVEGDPRIAWNGTVDMGADEFYTHLYYTGEATPGQGVDVKMIGQPTNDALLFLGTDFLVQSIPTMHGQWWLVPPYMAFDLDQVPSNGVILLAKRIPPDCPVPFAYSLQGIVQDWLTNLCVIEVR